MLKPPVACWLFGHTHYSSAQKWDIQRARFKPLDLGDNPTRASKLKKRLNASSEVLVCSNQLGYTHFGEAKTSRFNPFMTLSVSRAPSTTTAPSHTTVTLAPSMDSPY